MEPYPGAKAGSGVWQRIISQMPAHERYVEPFLGGGTIMALKRPAAINIGIDMDPLPFTALCPKLAHIPNLTLLPGIDAIHELGTTGLTWGKETLVYADPPYLGSTRAERRYYRCELMSPSDHARLLDTLKSLRCNVMLSGYPSPLYAHELRTWRRIEYTAATHGGPRVECLWMNYEPPAVLHDARFVGDGYRQREKLARRARRWIARLKAVPAHERQHLIDAIGNAFHPAARPDSRFLAVGSRTATTIGEIAPPASAVMATHDRLPPPAAVLEPMEAA